MVGQSEKAQNKESSTVEVIYDRVERVEENGKLDLRVESFKRIHVDRALPAIVKAMYPANAYIFEERSHTKWPLIESIMTCPGAIDKYKTAVRTITLPTGDKTSLPAEFEQYVTDRKKLDIKYFDFEEDVAELGLPDFNKGTCYSYKLFTVEVNHFGLQTLLESVAGSKMQNLFFNNYKNLVRDFAKWKDFTEADIEQLRNGEQVGEQTTFVSVEEPAEKK